MELEELRGHTLANELTSRNTNGTGPVEYEPEYDGAGHLVDDTEDYAYVWDAFGRLRQVKETGTGDLVAEYTYNGLGYRIGWHYDADTDGDVDGSDPWYRFVYDERWRIVATYRGSDSDPKEQFVHHAAGDSGYGTASYIDDVILRDRDDNSGWTSAADGTLEERIYHCQNWRHDVVALVDGNGAQVEMVRYSPYGVPFGLPAGDLDSDGDVDAADLTVFDALVAYDVRADLDLDGDYDVTDRNTINANRGTSAGLGVLSLAENRISWNGASQFMAQSHMRTRDLELTTGRWNSRDSLQYVDGPSQYAFGKCDPVGGNDPFGQTWIPVKVDGPPFRTRIFDESSEPPSETWIPDWIFVGSVTVIATDDRLAMYANAFAERLSWFWLCAGTLCPEYLETTLDEHKYVIPIECGRGGTPQMGACPDGKDCGDAHAQSPFVGGIWYTHSLQIQSVFEATTSLTGVTWRAEEMEGPLESYSSHKLSYEVNHFFRLVGSRLRASINPNVGTGGVGVSPRVEEGPEDVIKSWRSPFGTYGWACQWIP